MAHPNKVALVIPKLYIPSPESDGLSHNNPVLEHSISDGDLVFSLNMGTEMASYGSMYYMAPYGHSAKSVPLINLATVNYLLWGLQVGLRREKSIEWKNFYSKLTKGAIQRFPSELSEQTVWNFLQTFIIPFGVMHGSDLQGGQHEGSTNNIVTHGAVDYVSSFAVEGKLLHVNNLWRDCDVHENDDLILALRKMEMPHGDVNFNLSSSTRAFRAERVPISNSWYYLRPEVAQFRSFSDIPYIHVGRSQKYCSMYSRGKDLCCWDSRMCVVPGAPLQMTFEPGFVDSDEMHYAKWELNVYSSSSVEEENAKKAAAIAESNNSNNNKASAEESAAGLGRVLTHARKQPAAPSSSNNNNNNKNNKKQKTSSTSADISSSLQAFGEMLSGATTTANSDAAAAATE